jgi:hypothetical protein
MAHFEKQLPIILDGWDCLALPLNGRIVSIPDNVLLDELIRTPQPYKILPLLSIYEISESISKNAIKVINDKKKQPSWKSIAKALQGNIKGILKGTIERTNLERLYVVVSQNAYIISCSSDLMSQRDDLESQMVLQFYSNTIINYLHSEFSFPTETDLLIKEVCDKHGQCFETYQFAQMVQRYCEFILPYPYKTRFNREYNLHIDLNKPIKLHGNNESQIISQGISHSQRLRERFSLYSYTIAVQNRILGSLTREEKEVFDSRLFDRTDYLYTFDRKMARDQQKAKRQEPNRILLSPRDELHQCVFCYRFKFEPLPPQGNEFPQHCDRDECKLAYGRWLRHINRLEIRLTREEIVD